MSAAPTNSMVGIDLLEGEPGELRQAARAWADVAGKLRGKVDTLNSASSAALALDFRGRAAQEYAAYSGRLTNHLAIASLVCAQTGDACTQFADALERAQKTVERASWDGYRAVERKLAAEEDIADAKRREDGARKRGKLAKAKIKSAAGDSVNGPSTAAEGTRERDAAASDKIQAINDQDAAQGRRKRAIDELEEARGRARRAKQRAHEAAVDARAKFTGAQSVAQLKVPRVAFIPVPVTVQPFDAREAAAAVRSFIGGGPGRPKTPSDVRAAQIAWAKQHPKQIPPWLKSAIKVSDALGVADEIGGTRVKYDDLVRSHDDKLRKGPSATEKLMKNPLVKGGGRVLKPVGAALSVKEAHAQGRSIEDAAGKVIVDTFVPVPGVWEKISPAPKKKTPPALFGLPDGYDTDKPSVFKK